MAFVSTIPVASKPFTPSGTGLSCKISVKALASHGAARLLTMGTPPPGSYERSSSDIDFDMNGSGNGNGIGSGTLTAKTRKINGSIVDAVMQYDVANMDGTLVPLPAGSYQRTCRNIRLENAADGKVVIAAECEKINGEWVETRYTIPDIANIDGNLQS